AQPAVGGGNTSRNPSECAGRPRHSARSLRQRPARVATNEAGSTPPATASRPGTPGAPGARAPAPAWPGLLVSQTASPLSAQNVLDRGVFQGQLGVHPLEPGVLGFELLQALQLIDRGAGVLRAPLEVRRLADAVLPQDLCDRHAGLAL